MDALCQHIQEHINNAPKPILIAIDGACASGKSTFASHLAKTLQANLYHMDDFYLPFELRTRERMKEPGGNVHYERLIEEVLNRAKHNQNIAYRSYCSKTHAFSEPTHFIANPISILEGTYALHPLLLPYYTIKLFFTHVPETQCHRIEKRDGPKKRAEFELRWIPLENQYFQYLSPQSCADYMVDTSNWF